MIAAASDAQGVNMAPLFHFWGLAPSPELAQELETNYGFNSQLCEMLHYYKTIVPATGADLQNWYNNLDHQNWIMDDRYEIYVAEYDSAHYFDSIQAQIDFLIDTYGPCEFTSTEEQAESNITVNPNPTDGLVNVHFENGESFTVRVMSVDGRIVFQQKNVSGPNFSFILNEAPGLYIMQVNTGTDKVFFKIVKSN
ncbi:MAG: T9SS type A sorting domain-containing protein [Saprospiraceae bacterium]|nr:T9SS type A sorting domain-containing protein [Saprospiraceae bacterium]